MSITKDDYPEVPRDLLRPPRRNKQAVINALVAALEETLKIAERNERGDFGDRARAALALAKGENDERD